MTSKQPILSSFTPHFFFYSLVIFLTFTSKLASYANNETDHQSLLKIKLTITQDPFGALTSWNDSLHFCDWTYVTCGKRHRRVTHVVLNSQGLEGSLSPHVGNLSFLRELSLFNNSFQGPVPHEISRLSRLRVLDLGLNKFNEVIPTNMSDCTSLETLDISYNELVGNIPLEISFLSKLTYLSLTNNKLTGGIPSLLGNITSIEGFYVNINPLGGSIPDTLGNWKSLKQIYLGTCNLSGAIPYSLYNLSIVTHFSLANNQLTGSLPPAIGAMLPHLVFFQLRDNLLTMRFPSSISNCSRLRYLDMRNNMFSGKLIIDFAKLREIYFINLGGNLFGSKDADEMKFIDSLNNCTMLDTLALSYCKFQGVLPISIGNLSHQLNYLYLHENQLHGNLPSSIGNLVGLEMLSLGYNQFTGSIPISIGYLQNLEKLGIFNNQLSGKIPDSVGNLSLLIILALSSNMLEGVIPSSLGNCQRLLELYLNDNKLNGEIPAQVFQLSSLSIKLDLSQNNLSGSLPIEVGDLNMLIDLDLSDNNLSSKIPSSLGGCTSLSRLSLKGNLFQGMIPPSLNSLKALMWLDISRNNLSGQVPFFLERLQYLNLSYNDFEGRIPTTGVFANASAFSGLGNSGLCGDSIRLGLPICKETKNHRMRFPLSVIIILSASTLFIIICLVYVWCKKKNKSEPSQPSADSRFLKVSYIQLFKATDGFSEANLIGHGGFGFVYKGILGNNDDRFVAIKVLRLQNQEAKRSFMRECEAWRNIRHRNILKMITSCSSVDFQGNNFKALVYEFMPNGSLHDLLHSSENISGLSLPQIISILIDVASALDYIHNHCLPPVVHGDLKPSNILLDDDMVAHVGDFGLARFLGTTSHQNNSTGIRGTIGYAAPEYGLGSEMTCTGDIYSFGILVLEVMTGKKPTNDIFNEGLNIHKFASMALQDRVTNVINVSILNVYKEQNKEANAKKIEECLASTINTGVSCSMESPQQRMDIKKVIHELQHILDTLRNV
ncbi:putative receptor-like protein kinase At3g47110 [Bidens hawaiensis]|uniref:putative receptor-like protein kinase At3g47110 n=1 Tax=Bidens hawaiensis TaxID=980011 RepID=UPI00404AA7F9